MSTAAEIEEETIAVCNSCSSGYQYADAAAQAAQFQWAGGWVPESDDVYVINIPVRKALAYRVTRTRVDPDPFIVGDEVLELDVDPIEGDAVFLGDLSAALELFGSLRNAMTQDLPADQLVLPDHIDSALDLVGPDAYARDNRTYFQTALTNYYKRFWDAQLVGLRDTIERAIERVLAESDIDQNSKVEIEFEDGTVVSADVVDIDADIGDPKDLIIEFDVDEHSVWTGDRFVIPQDSDSLNRLDGSTDDPDLAREVQDLLQRLGAQIFFAGGDGSGGSGCTTTWSCRDSTCTLTYSC